MKWEYKPEALDYPVHTGKALQITFIDLSQELHSQNQMVNSH